MATEDRTVSIVFQGVDRVSDTITHISSSLESVSSATAPFADLAKNVLTAEAALAALAAGGLAYAYSQSVKFEAASIDLQKVLGDEAGKLAEAERNAVALSGAYGVSAREVLASTANFKQAGFSIEESMTLAKNSLDLVIAGDVDAARASEILVAALKGFREPASEAARLIDILNGVSNTYATDVAQLATGMASLSPIAQAMGFSMEETAGVLTPVIEVFRSGDEAANALKVGLLRLIDDSKPVEMALKSIGVSQRDANGQLRSGRDILMDVGSAFQALDQNQKLFVASQLVGIEQGARMVTVFDQMGKVGEITATAMGSAGSAAEEVALRLASAEVTIARFKTGLDNLAMAMGDKFKTAATEVVAGGVAIEGALLQIVQGGGLDSLATAFEALLGDLARLLQDVAANLPEAFAQIDFSGLLQSLESIGGAMGDAFSALTGGVDLSTVDGLRSAIQTVVDLLAGLTNTSAGVVNGLQPLFAALRELAEGFAGAGAEGQEMAGQFLGMMQTVNTFAEGLSAAGGAVEGLSDGLLLLGGSSVINAVGNLAGKIGAANVAGSLGGAMSSAAAAAGPLLAALTGPVGLTAAAAAAVVSLAAWAESEREIKQLSAETLEIEKQLAGQRSEVAGRLREISNATGLTVNSMDDLNRLQREGILVYNEATGAWEAAAAAQRTLSGSADDATQALTKQQDQAHQLQLKMAELTSQENIVRIKAETEINLAQITADTERIKAALQLEGLQTQEVTKRIQSMYEFNAAAVVAEADKIKAAFSGVADSIGSVSGVFGSFTDLMKGGDAFDRMRASYWIDQALDQQELLVKAQARLADSQSRLAEIKAQKLANGEALIKIEADGLEPALEQVLWSILEKVQLKVAMEQAELLLGLGVEVTP